MMHLKRINKKFLLNGNIFRPLSSQAPIQEVPYKDTLKGKEVITPREVPKEADVVVIGGGSLGCSTLYNLVKLGTTNVVLLEANQITSGTTWHSAGLVWRPRLNDIDIRLVSKTREIIDSLEGETGINPGFVKSGMICIAKTKDRFKEFQRISSVVKNFQKEGQFLNPKETKELCPLFNVDDVYASLYFPDEGSVEPAGLCSALIRSATRGGAKVIEKCPVLDIRTEPTLYGGKKVTEVVTSFGTIKTSKVVNATGAWANYITNMVGVSIPVVPLKHAYFVTDKIPGMQKIPTVREPDSGIYIRPHGTALIVGGFEYDPVILDKVEKDFHFGMFDFDWDVFGVHLEAGVNRLPVLEEVGVKSTVCGPESFTPDHKAIMGEDPNVNGFYHCCALNSTGIMFGGGCGHQMAHWVTKGRPELDMFAYDIRRFHPSLIGNKTWAVERTHESYAKTYALNYRHEEPLAARNQKKSPLHDILLQKGCVFQERHGWERPGWFNSSAAPVQHYDWDGKYGNALSEDTRYKDALSADYTYGFPTHQKYINEECLAARTKAALFDMSYCGQIFITGPDAQKAADWLFTADMRKDVGNVINSFMLNEQGGVEAGLCVSIIGESDVCNWEPELKNNGFYLTIGGGVTLQNKAHILKELRNHKWDVELIDFTDKMGILSLQGPKSKEILQEVSDVQLDNDNFPFLTHKTISIAGHKVRAFRCSSVGELGWEIHATTEAIIPIYKVLHNAGEKHQLKDCGYRAIDSLSCEKGSLDWHAEIRPDDNLKDADLHLSCKLETSTPFLGRNALSNKVSGKAMKKLATFTLNDSSIALCGLEGILRNGEQVGYVRRTEYALHLGRSIARGYVTPSDGKKVSEEFLNTGNWEVDVLGKKQPVTLHLQQPFDPNNRRIQGIYEE